MMMIRCCSMQSCRDTHPHTSNRCPPPIASRCCRNLLTIVRTFSLSRAFSRFPPDASKPPQLTIHLEHCDLFPPSTTHFPPTPHLFIYSKMHSAMRSVARQAVWAPKVSRRVGRERVAQKSGGERKIGPEGGGWGYEGMLAI